MNALIGIGTFFAMEPLTWLIHRYVMHGFLWVLHKDHHDHSNEGHLEKNDYFFVIFAIPAILLILEGTTFHNGVQLAFGLGITAYGMGYFFVHDIFIHQRIGIMKNTQNPYFLAIRRAHKQHHKHVGKEEGECFGFLWVPLKYFRMYFKKSNQ